MSKRSHKLFLNDIHESVNAILSYIENINFDQFISDRKTYSAVIREFEIIGEAIKHLPEEILQQYTEVEWRDIKDFRNLLIHEYFGVDFEIIWNVIVDDLPKLKKAIISMLEK